MKQVYSLLLLLCAAYGVVAQSSERDSLLAVIKARPDDTSTLNAYFLYGNLMENFDLDSAVYYYQRARAVAKKGNHIIGQLRYAWNHSAVLNFKGQLEESYRVNKEAVNLALASKLPLETAKAYFNLGNVLNHQGRYDSASVYYIKAVELFDKLRETSALNMVYQSLSAVYDGMRQYEQAVTYAERSIALSRKLQDSVTLSSGLINKGNSLAPLKRLNEAQVAYEEALKISQLIGHTYHEHSAYISLGYLAIKQQQYDTAVHYYQRALAAARQLDYKASVSVALGGIANAHLKKGNYNTADRYIQEAIYISEKTKIYADLSEQYKVAADVKANLGQHEQAFNYLLKYVELSDSLTNAEVKNTIAELEKKYETAKKDKALLDQQLLLTRNKAELTEKQNWLIAALAGIAVVGLLFILSYLSYRNKRRLQQKNILALQKEAEVIRLKATLEGQQEERQRIAKEIHDEIGSGLTTIVFLSDTANGDKEKNNKIGNTARQLVTQMNEIVWSMNADQDKLEELVAYIRHNISEMLNAVDMDYRFDIPDRIPDRIITGVQRRNIYLAVKEAVHNSIKHAGASVVTIKMDFSNGVAIQVEDNGKGIQYNAMRKFGNGMRNMQQRMETTGGVFRLVSDKPVQVRMELPADKII